MLLYYEWFYHIGETKGSFFAILYQLKKIYIIFTVLNGAFAAGIIHFFTDLF